MSRSSWVTVAVLAVGLVALLPSGSVDGMPSGNEGPTGAVRLLEQMAVADARSKIDGALLQIASEAPDQEAWITVMSARPVDLGAYSGYVHQFTWPAGEHVSILAVRAADIPTIAALPGVFGVADGDAGLPGVTAGVPGVEGGAGLPGVAAGVPGVEGDAGLPGVAAGAPGVEGGAGLPGDAGATSRAGGYASTLRAAPPWSGTSDRASAAEGSGTSDRASAAAGSGAAEARLSGWYDVNKGHAASEAWAAGYRGDGVRVAVLDYAVDFAHPDLQGTWATLPDGHPYAGWPQVFDPTVGYIAIQDGSRQESQRYSRTARSGMIEMYQTSPVTATNTMTGVLRTACLRPGIYVSRNQSFQLGDVDCAYVVPESLSGEVRFGHHPDAYLRAAAARPAQNIAGEWAGVLLVDGSVAGVYDTVYVDLDGDRDFTDEKPMTKAAPLSWRDTNGDGLADVTGGLLYWIADGELPFPSSWLWGIEDQVPEAYSVVGVHWASSSHGTLCASNIVGQGVLTVPDGSQLVFRDLPDGGRPPSTNLGMSPDAELVSIGSVYSGGGPIWGASWRYGVFGHDPTRNDDDVQVTSNSYGFSDVDQDAWDGDSRLVDFYVRTYSPTTTFLLATGNGGPGYGTIVAPEPATSLGVGASTQMGSTGWDSITDTQQITFGDIIPWSNRGPGADGRGGVAVAADGAYAAGAVPINTRFNGARANATWGGTSRATPVASGAMALLYEAFLDRHGRWPRWDEARAILMSGARHAGYDTLVQGAGVIDAADAVRIASGARGVYALPSEWTAGGYHGVHYPSFANLMMPGETATTTLTLHNPTDRAVEVELSAKTLRRIGSYEESIVADRRTESPPSSVVDQMVSVDRERVPEGTELMVVRGVYPLLEFDPDRDNAAENTLGLGVFQHTDVNGDGALWDDTNEDGVVNHAIKTNAFVDVLDDPALRLDAIEATFTKDLGGDGHEGLLAWFGTGCDNAPRPQDVTGKVALISRSSCNYAQQVGNAASEGASAVVEFSDLRAKVAMGGSPAAGIPAVMIDGRPGEALRDRLIADESVTVALGARTVGPTSGLDGAAPVQWAATELQQYEYMRLNYDGNQRNHWAVPVHHPLERWSDGMYVGLWHPTRTEAVTETHVTLRFDFYRYEPWQALELSRRVVSIPARGSATVSAMLTVDAAASPGVLQGAIFADQPRVFREPSVYLPYLQGGSVSGHLAQGRAAGQVYGDARSGGFGYTDDGVGARQADEDNEAELLPGGYELPQLRTVIPVNANVASAYDWEGSVALGGAEAHDPEAPYDNGAMWGTFKWGWRAESGDWRFFFVDAEEPPENTFWLFRTQWDEPRVTEADIDTRVWGPTLDRFSDTDHPDNRDEDMSDPVWYGPHTMERKVSSPYLARGSTWPFDTTSGGAEDWLVAEAAGGLHEVMLHNVLFSGGQFSMPYETTVGSLQLSEVNPRLVADTCTNVTITPTIEIDGFVWRAYGPAVPEVLVDQPVAQDPAAFAQSGYQHAVTLTQQAGGALIALRGASDDRLDLYLLYDANGNGQFDPNNEVLARSTGAGADKSIAVGETMAAGAYQVWVHGQRVTGADKSFDLSIDIAQGANFEIRNAPESLPSGTATDLSLCALPEELQGWDGPSAAVLVAGPDGAPGLMRLPLTWSRRP